MNEHSRKLQLQRVRNIHERIGTLERPRFRWRSFLLLVAAILVLSCWLGAMCYLFVPTRSGEAVVFIPVFVTGSIVLTLGLVAASQVSSHVFALHQHREIRRQLHRDAARAAVYLREDEHVEGGLTAIEQDVNDKTQGALSAHRIEW